MSSIELIAHRGNAAEFPENTLPALRSALELGLRHLSIGVQLTRDGEAVVLHDHDLRRTAGCEGSVLDLSITEAVAVEVAERDRFSDRFAGTRLPRLSDVAKLLSDWPDATLFVELRRASLARHGAEKFVSAVLAALRDCADRCVLVSPDLPAIELARVRGPARVGWMLPAVDSHSHLKCEALCPDFVFIDERKLPAGVALWRGPWRWAVHEVASLPQALVLAARGAGFIQTMRVRALARELISRAP